MADARLQEELATSKAEILWLRESLSPRISATLEPIVRKDLSLNSLISKCAGSESGVPIDEFVATIEGSARLGKWDEKDQIRISFKIDGSSPVVLKRMPRTPRGRRNLDKIQKCI
jgi:hypothetical protein